MKNKPDHMDMLKQVLTTLEEIDLSLVSQDDDMILDEAWELINKVFKSLDSKQCKNQEIY